MNEYKATVIELDKYYEITIYSNRDDEIVTQKLKNEFNDFRKYKYKNQITYFIKTNTNHIQYFNHFFRETLNIDYDLISDL